MLAAGVRRLLCMNTDRYADAVLLRARAVREGVEVRTRLRRQYFRDQPHVGHALDELMVRKSPVPGLSSVNAPDLATLGIFDAATALLLAGDSALEAAKSRMREIPFAVPTPRESDSGTGGGWVGPTTSLPVVKGFVEPLTLKPRLIGSIVVFADELLRAPNSDAVDPKHDPRRAGTRRKFQLPRSLGGRDDGPVARVDC